MSATDGTLKENPHAWSNDYNVTCRIGWSFGWDGIHWYNCFRARPTSEEAKVWSAKLWDVQCKDLHDSLVKCLGQSDSICRGDDHRQSRGIRLQSLGIFWRPQWWQGRGGWNEVTLGRSPNLSGVQSRSFPKLKNVFESRCQNRRQHEMLAHSGIYLLFTFIMGKFYILYII